MINTVCNTSPDCLGDILNLRYRVLQLIPEIGWNRPWRDTFDFIRFVEAHETFKHFMELFLVLPVPIIIITATPK
jgi:hypothetical protein